MMHEWTKPSRPVVGIAFFGLVTGCLVMGQELPDGFVDLQDVVPTIGIELRYLSTDNFVGTRVDGYQEQRCIMTAQTAHALSKVQRELVEFGLGLKVFDAYRPQQAVDHFVRWAKDLDDTKAKAKYYPRVAKQHLFRDGYIAARSGHSRGSTVDLTIVSLQDGAELDMGSVWDFFDPVSWPTSDSVDAKQKANRLLLRTLMIKHGFKPLQQEWWHFSLVSEVFPSTYFNFPIE